MNTLPTGADLPPQLRTLSAKVQDLPDAVRDALQASLAVAAQDATPEQVLTDTFAQLGYLGWPDNSSTGTRGGDSGGSASNLLSHGIAPISTSLGLGDNDDDLSERDP